MLDLSKGLSNNDDSCAPDRTDDRIAESGVAVKPHSLDHFSVGISEAHGTTYFSRSRARDSGHLFRVQNKSYRTNRTEGVWGL